MIDLLNYYPYGDSGPLFPFFRDQDFLQEAFSINSDAKRAFKAFCKKHFARSLPVSVTIEGLSSYMIKIFEDVQLRYEYERVSIGTHKISGSKKTHLTDASLSNVIRYWASQQSKISDFFAPVIFITKSGRKELIVENLANYFDSALTKQTDRDFLITCLRFIYSIALDQQTNRDDLFELLQTNNVILDLIKTVPLAPLMPHDFSAQQSLIDESTVYDKSDSVVECSADNTIREATAPMPVCVLATPNPKLAEATFLTQTLIHSISRYSDSCSRSSSSVQDIGSSVSTQIAKERLQQIHEKIASCIADLSEKEGALYSNLRAFKKFISCIDIGKTLYPNIIKSRQVVADFIDHPDHTTANVEDFTTLCSRALREYDAFLEFTCIADTIHSLNDAQVVDSLISEATIFIASINHVDIDNADQIDKLRATSHSLTSLLNTKLADYQSFIALLQGTLSPLLSSSGLLSDNTIFLALEHHDFLSANKIWANLHKEISSALSSASDLNCSDWLVEVDNLFTTIDYNDSTSYEIIRLIMELTDQRWPLAISRHDKVVPILHQVSIEAPDILLKLLQSCPGIALSAIQNTVEIDTTGNQQFMHSSFQTIFFWLHYKNAIMLRYLFWAHLTNEDDIFWKFSSEVLVNYVRTSINLAIEKHRRYNFSNACNIFRKHKEYLQFSDDDDASHFIYLIVALAAVAQGDDKYLEDIYQVGGSIGLNRKESFLRCMDLYEKASSHARLDMLVQGDYEDEESIRKNLLHPHDYGASRIAYEIEEDVILAQIDEWMNKSENISSEELTAISEAIDKYDVPGNIDREMRKRMRKGAALKDAVVKSLIHRTQNRLSGLKEYLSRISGRNHTMRIKDVLVEEAPSSCRDFIDEVTLVLRMTNSRPHDVHIIESDREGLPAWFLYGDINETAELGYCPDFALRFLNYHTAEELLEYDSEKAYADLISTEWVGNDEDAQIIINKLCNDQQFTLARLVCECFPQTTYQDVIACAISEISDLLKNGCVTQRIVLPNWKRSFSGLRCNRTMMFCGELPI